MVCTLNLKNDNLVVYVILFYMNYVVLLKWQDKLGKERNLKTLFCEYLDNHFLEREVGEEWRLWKVWLLSKI